MPPAWLHPVPLTTWVDGAGGICVGQSSLPAKCEMRVKGNALTKDWSVTNDNEAGDGWHTFSCFVCLAFMQESIIWRELTFELERADDQS